MTRSLIQKGGRKNPAGWPHKGAGRTVASAVLGLFLVLVLIVQPAAAAAPQAGPVSAESAKESLARTAVDSAKSLSDPDSVPNVVIGGVDLGNLPNYLLFFANGSEDANWQGATKGFVGDVAVDGIQADERTSGGVPYAGTIYTNDSTLSAWAGIVDQNDPSQVSPAQAFGVTGQTARISGLETDLNSVFAQINALLPSVGYNSVSSTSLNGLNTTGGGAQTFVINITSGLGFSSKINITGDAGDVFILRWDSDGNPNNGYQGQVKPQSGGAIVPLGGLKATNFINVAGDINSSGGGSNPAAPYPQGPRYNDGTGALIVKGANFKGGGFFTGYWLTTGDPTNGDTSASEQWHLRRRLVYPHRQVQHDLGHQRRLCVTPCYTVAAALDFGDAPTAAQSGFVGTYPTTLANNGARHTATGPTLGTARDTEADGQPTPNANGDDNTGVPDDEDGVTIPALTQGLTAGLTVNASATAKLDAWIDWNRDGDWADAGEQVATNLSVNAGNNTLNVPVPPGASLGTTYARFRLSTVGGLAVTGAAADGEVEDYAVTVRASGTDLQIVKSASPSPVVLGQHLTYTLLVTNQGSNSATGVTVVDTLPSGSSYVSSTASQGSCNHAAGVVTCNLGTISSGGSATITIVVTVNSVMDVPAGAGNATVTADAPAAPAAPEAANLIDEILGSARRFAVFHGMEAGHPSQTWSFNNSYIWGDIGIGPGSDTNYAGGSSLIGDCYEQTGQASGNGCADVEPHGSSPAHVPPTYNDYTTDLTPVVQDIRRAVTIRRRV